MQFDQHRIVIRERGLLEILDLALRVIRAYAWPLAVAFAAGALPMICLNAWLLADLAEFDTTINASFETNVTSYAFYMILLVIWEMPLAMAPITLCLGQALFTDRPRLGETVRGLRRSFPQMLWYQVIVRAVLTPWVVTWFFLFASWPYLGEVILLERNPMRRGRSGRMTTALRKKALHGGGAAELFVRWLGSLAVGSVLFVSFWCCAWFLRNWLLNERQWDAAMYTVYGPLALWLVVGYFTVVRFLAYLDLRIRREGWEIELMMRAEQTRLMKQWT